MSTLEGKSIATTYKDLLQVSNNNVGIDSTIRPIEDGEGTQSALALSTDTIEIRGSIIPSTNSTFDIGSAERKIRHLYLSSNSLYVGDLQFSEQDVQEVKNVRNGAYATSTQGALAETAIQPGEFAFSLLSEIPTTLAGYGITDAATAAQGAAADTALAKASTALQPGGVSFTDDLTDRPTTIAGYGITDAFNGSFSNLTDRPTSLAGYGITDAATSAQGDKADSALQPGAIIPFSNVSNKPTSLAGYGITDAATSAQGDKADSALQPGATIPWSTVSNTPTTLTGYEITDAATSAQGDKADSALQPNTSIHVNTMHVSGGKIYGPATMYIDPEAIGDNTGKLVILGDLQVDGVTTTVNSTTVSVSGKTIELAGGAGDPAEVDGAGVTVAASDASMLYKVTTDSWDFNKKLATAGLSIVPSSDDGFAFKVHNSAGTERGGLYINSDNGSSLRLKDNSSNTDILLNTTGPSYMMGNVGIGTTNPDAGLHVFSSGNGELEVERSSGAKINLQAQSAFATIGTESNHDFGIKANSAVIMRLTTSGRVGIGTTNPSTLLHVAPRNNVDANGDPTNESYFKVYDNATSGTAQGRNGGVVYIDANYYLDTSDIFAVNGRGDNKFIIKGNGNVGIGTTDPGEILHVGKSVGTTLVKTEVAGNSVVGFDIKKTGATNQEWRIVDGQTINGKLEIYDVTDSRSVMAFDGDGKVGIGTTNPGAKLEIQTSTLSQEGIIVRNSLGNITSELGGHTTDGSGYLTVKNKDGNNQCVLRNNGNSYLNALGGNVGIGTDNPDLAKLQVHGDSASTRAGLLISDTTGRASAVHQVDDKLLFDDYTSGATRMVINGSTGNVGIGTTSPGVELDVVGSARVSSSMKVSGLTYTDANSSGYQTNQTISVNVPSVAEGVVYHVVATKHIGSGHSQLRVAYLHYSSNGTPFLEDSMPNSGVNLTVSGATVSVTNGTSSAVLKLRVLRVG